VKPYEVKRIDEFDALPLEELNMTWRPIRRTLGITAFGINAYTGDTGRQVVEEHTEGSLRHEEVYVVLNGLARFTLGEEEVVAGAGTIVYLRDPDTKRGAVALEDGTTVLAVGGRPGHAYEPSAWEWWFAATPLRQSGDLEGALAIVQDGLEQRPGHPVLHYQVACYKALLGRRDDALANLRRATEGDARTADWARKDEDFVSVKDDPEFLAITGQADSRGAGA
jgi:hypothetical protein